MDKTKEKYNSLLRDLRTYSELCVAFSGGIDSTFLLHSAIEALGINRVTAVHIVSQLCSKSSMDNAKDVLEANFSKKLNYIELEVFPLEWEEFVINDVRRCYYCKKRMYTTVLSEMEKRGVLNLADGTNLDDLSSDRPGLLAIEELKVFTPLAQAMLSKNEIRLLAQSLGLTNYALPSNSCLATRVATSDPIRSEALQIIEQAEVYLAKLGFLGCRVRIISGRTIIEVQKKDIEGVFTYENRIAILNHMKGIGFSNISISIEGRD